MIESFLLVFRQAASGAGGAARFACTTPGSAEILHCLSRKLIALSEDIITNVDWRSSSMDTAACTAPHDRILGPAYIYHAGKMERTLS